MHKTAFSVVLGLVLVVALAGAAAFATNLYRATPLELIVHMDPTESSSFVRWSAERAFYAFPPSDAEVAELNAEAGARYAASFPDQAEAQRLLDFWLAHGVDINSVDRANGSGLTALHAASLRGDAAPVRLLLEHGADPRLTDAEGRTALDLARVGEARNPNLGFREVARLLEAAMQ